MRREKTILVMLVATLLWALTLPGAALAADDGSYKTAGGLAVYLGVLPAAMIQGRPKDHPEEAMHGGIPRGRHVFHIMAAVFDAESGERIEDAAVEARVAEPGLAGVTRRLEPMLIEGTITYGNYFQLSGDGRYRIAFAIGRPGLTRPVEVEFTYEHRTQ